MDDEFFLVKIREELIGKGEEVKLNTIQELFKNKKARECYLEINELFKKYPDIRNKLNKEFEFFYWKYVN